MGIKAETTFQLDQHEQKLASELFKEYQRGLLRSIEDAETLIVGEAERLVAEFRARRLALHQSVIASLGSGGSKSAVKYSKLQIFTRWRGGSLQIYWQEVHVLPGAKTAKYKYIPFHKPGGYEIRRLQAEASYAADLVGEYEARAAQLRSYWTNLQDVKRSTRTALQRLPAYASTFAVEQAALNGPQPRTHSHLDSLVIAG